MSQLILFISVLLVHHTTQRHQEVEKKCNDDATLECPVSSTDFFSLTWYKDKIPIIRKRKDQTQPSNFSRDAMFGENLSLFLPKVKPGDSGKYTCGIRANVGQQNKEGHVFLKVNDTECVTQNELTPVTTILNSTHSNKLFPVKDVPLTWSVAGYLTLALVKILLSLISIQMIHVVFSRRQENRLRR